MLNLRLKKLNIFDDQKAFNNFESFIFSENSQKIKENDLEKMQNFADCNSDEKFKTFIHCFEKDFRSWQSYSKSNIRNKVILEEIVAYSLILLEKKKINTDIIFKTNEDIDNVTFYKGKDFLVNETLKEDPKKTFYLKNDKDGFIFLENLINFYTSDEYSKKINTEFSLANTSQNYFIEKYENRNFWEKIDDIFANPDNRKTIKIAETAVAVYFTYDFIKSLKNGNLTKVDDLFNNKNNQKTSNSNFSKGTLITQDGKWQPAMFRFTPRGNVLRKKWMPIVFRRGGFF